VRRRESEWKQTFSNYKSTALPVERLIFEQVRGERMPKRMTTRWLVYTSLSNRLFYCTLQDAMFGWLQDR
jgi:hypothetical protein